MRKWIALTAAVAVLTFIGCSGKSEQTAKVPGKGVLKGPGDTSITQGKEEKIWVSIDRPKGSDAPVEFTIEGLPKGVTAEGTQPYKIDKGAPKTDVTLKAANDAPPEANKEVKIVPKGGEKAATFKLTVKGK